MNIELIERPSVVADRRKFIGGSDVAAILGISPWRTPLQLWNDKTQPTKPTNNLAPSSAPTSAARWNYKSKRIRANGGLHETPHPEHRAGLESVI